MMLLDSGQVDYDAVWPANSLWIDLGDKSKLVKDAKSILWSPVVLGVKKSIARRLGWVGKKDVKVEDILKAAESGKLRFMMTSATQSNSGASAYLGFLYAFAGKPDLLTSADLNKPAVRANIKRILGSVNRSSGSSGFLKDLFLQKYDGYDAMVNYEAVLIETNQEVAQQGKEPLYAVYPSDGLAIADSPLGYVDHGDARKAELFKKLQDYLLTASVQQELAHQGRRTGSIGEGMKDADPAVFKKDWGIDVGQFYNQIKYPKAEVIREALNLYQTAFRKPSLTVYVLDYSGSMKGQREEGLKTAMHQILNQDEARKSLLQGSSDDITEVITFSNDILDDWTVRGSKPEEMDQLWAKINARTPDGGTAIFSAVGQAMDHIKAHGSLDKYFPAVILMTDGESNAGMSFEDLKSHVQQLQLGADVPVMAILFGEASTDQLDQITRATSGKVFDGKKDLTRAFREAKGYN
jgi:Ca-activated chloride channel family protein